MQASTGPQANRTTNFLWDVNQALPQIALERDGNNALTRSYTYGQRRISQTAGGATSYFLYDGLGSVASLASSTGSVQWMWSYEPFGATRTEQKANGNQPDVFTRFAGEYLDPTGLYHLRSRQYDPASGLFLTVDPLTGGGSVSRYVYAQNRPTVLIDPTGLLSWKDVKDASIGVAKTIPDTLHSIENAAEIAEERAGIPEHIKQIPRVGATALRLLPVTVAVITVGDVYINVRSGDSIPTAIGRSLFRTGGAILGAGRAASGCAVFIESGPGLVACAGVAGVAGAFGGERAGDALATRILGRSEK